jgi:small subunit ribosomal protein S6
MTFKKNLYEGMYIISSTLSDEARQKSLDRIQASITQRGGEVLKIHDRGRSRLAYEIDGHKEGHYFVLYFDLPPSEVNDLWSDYHLNEDLVRFMTTRTEQVMDTIEFKVMTEEE